VIAAIILAARPQAPTAQSPRATRINGREVAADRVIVKFREGSASTTIRGAARASSAIERHPLNDRGLVLAHSASMTASELIATFSTEPDVEYVEPDYLVRGTVIPNDVDFARQWGLLNTRLLGADIHAPEAWNVAKGDSRVVIGISDSAIALDHPDLQPNIWRAPWAFTVSIAGQVVTCPAGSHGVRTHQVQIQCETATQFGAEHGTHVAGIAGAAGNNGRGIAGVNWNASLMALTFMDGMTGLTSDAIKALEFAIQVKSQFAGTALADVRVINASWGFDGASQALRDEIGFLGEHEVLFVAAAQNGSRSLDAAPADPATAPSPNVLAVAASTSGDALAGFSNFGQHSVHLVAPGDQILSTVPGGWGYLSGTSMAAPFVAGAAALVLSRCPMSTLELKRLLLDSVDRRSQFQALTITGGRLNVGRAVQTCSAAAPPRAPSITLNAPLDGTEYFAPAAIALDASALDTDGAVTSVQFYAGSTVIGSVYAAPFRALWSEVPPGTYSLRAMATDNAGLRTTSNASRVTVLSGNALPTSWVAGDVGVTGRPGSTNLQDGMWTVRGAGSDIGGTVDAFHFARRQWSGNGEIVARVVSLQHTHALARAGIMIRRTLAADSAHAMMSIRPGGEIEFVARELAGLPSVIDQGPAAHGEIWFKLSRNGSEVTGFSSDDGIRWAIVGRASIGVGDVGVGLVANSHDPAFLTTAIIDRLAITRVPALQAPEPPSLPNPADGASAVAMNQLFRWTSPRATHYEIRFGLNNPPQATHVTALDHPYFEPWPGAITPGRTHYWQIIARNSAGTTIGPVWSFAAAGTATWPGAWSSRDVGATGRTGSAAFSGDRVTVQGAGADIWGTSDGFHYVYQPLTGDGEIVARVVTLQNTHTFAKAGIMIRESLAANAAHVLLSVRPAGGLEFMTRRVAAGTTSFIAGGTRPAPVWLRLQRRGATFLATVSSDGQVWTSVGVTSVALPAAVTIGFVVSSHTTTSLNSAVFDRISVGQSQADDIVIHASDVPASARHGGWTSGNDARSPNGIKLVTADNAVANLDRPLPAPADYVDLNFIPRSNTPYRIWLRLRALNDSKFNDAVWVQFSDSNANGLPIYRIGSVSGLLVNLATDATAASLNAWGWKNGAYWLNQPTAITFTTATTHTLRIQVREDGVQWDQIVLSPARYFNAAPGPPSNDATIVPKP
jgi:subtilisin family serine protease/regulation of enolase protein 1 (concanavalin A-like superfamily)